jgi:dihydrofolate reductase
VKPGRPELVLIAAVARNGVIGCGNRLLWRLPEDLRYFASTTSGHPVIMGRKTWESLPSRFRPLPRRRNIVVTRQPGFDAPGAKVAGSLDAALALLEGLPKAFVIGGAALYAQAIGDADTLLLTEIDRDFEGDASFPRWDPRSFRQTQRETHHAAAPNDFDYAFVTYRRIAA